MKFTDYRIGRFDADLAIGDPTVSNRHAELTVTAGGLYYLTDCTSANGTYVLRRGSWRKIQQDFISLDEQVRFGNHCCTLAQLVAQFQAGGGKDRGSQDPAITRGATKSDPKDALPEGGVKRDPLSGDIISKAQDD